MRVKCWLSAWGGHYLSWMYLNVSPTWAWLKTMRFLGDFNFKKDSKVPHLLWKFCLGTVNLFPLCQVITSWVIKQSYLKIWPDLHQAYALFKAFSWRANRQISCLSKSLCFYGRLCVGIQWAWTKNGQRVTSVKENSWPHFSAHALQIQG